MIMHAALIEVAHTQPGFWTASTAERVTSVLRLQSRKVQETNLGLTTHFPLELNQPKCTSC